MTKRLIDTELWNNEDIITNFTAEDKYFWLYLLTSPYNNVCGVFKNKPSLIARDMGLHKDTIVNLLYRFENVHRLLYVDRNTDEALILNWYKFNWTKSADFMKTVEKKLSSIESETIRGMLLERMEKKMDKTVLRPSIDGTITNTISNTNTNSNTLNSNSKSKKDTFNIQEVLDIYNFTDNINSAILKWLQYKKEKRQSYTKTGLGSLLEKVQSDLREFGETYVLTEFEHSMANNWNGVYPPKGDKTKVETQPEPKAETKVITDEEREYQEWLDNFGKV